MNVVYSSARGSSARTMNRSRWLTCGSSPCARAQTTTSRATAAGSGRVDEEPAGPRRARGRHLPDQGALVADDRRVELELAREAHRARDHPAGDERDHDAARARGADRRHGVRPDDQVVADERAVDVEGDEADRARSARGSGRRARPDDARPPPRALEAARSGRVRRTPARARPRDARQAGQVDLDRAPPAGQALGDAARRSPRPGRRRSRAARRRRRPAPRAADRRAGR